jgi:hypothetical protein
METFGATPIILAGDAAELFFGLGVDHAQVVLTTAFVAPVARRAKLAVLGDLETVAAGILGGALAVRKVAGIEIRSATALDGTGARRSEAGGPVDDFHNRLGDAGVASEPQRRSKQPPRSRARIRSGGKRSGHAR